MPQGEWLTLGEVTAVLGCSDGLVTKLAQKGTLKRRLDPETGRWRYRRREVLRQRDAQLEHLRKILHRTPEEMQRAKLVDRLQAAQLRFALVRRKVAEMLPTEVTQDVLEAKQEVEQLESELLGLDRNIIVGES